VAVLWSPARLSCAAIAAAVMRAVCCDLWLTARPPARPPARHSRTHKLAIVITAYDTMNAEAGEDHDFAGRVFMKEVLTSAMERERRRMERINRDRVKFQSVIERENDLLLQRRKEFEEREREMQQRAKRIEMQQQRS
ncbi:MAG: hypothetical protein ACK4WK_12020, partial [Anaerolineae bacterium]